MSRTIQFEIQITANTIMENQTRKNKLFYNSLKLNMLCVTRKIHSSKSE